MSLVSSKKKLLWYFKSNCFPSFFGRIEDTKKTFRNLLTFKNVFFLKKIGASGQSWRRQRPSLSKSLMEHVREKYNFVFNKDKFSLDDYKDSINFGDLPASSPPPSGKIFHFCI